MVHRKQKKGAALFFVKLFIILMNTCLFMLVWYVYYSPRLYRGAFYNRGDYVIAALYFYIFAVMAKIYKGLDLRTSRISELIYSQVIAVLISTGMIYMVILLLTRRAVNVLPLLLQALVACGVSILWSYVANHLTNRIYKPAKILLVYDNTDAYKKAKMIIDKLVWRFELVGEVRLEDAGASSQDPDGIIAAVASKISETCAGAVMLCGVPSTRRNNILKYCIDNDIVAFVRPNTGDFMISNADVVQMANLPVFICERYTPGLVHAFVKRAMDILLSLIGIIVTSPILLITAIAIKAYDGGPALYKQVRLTKDGARFNILKFRSMRVDAEKDGVARLSSQGDSRITPVGRFIRGCRIDELPQLFNIIRGQLSIVGPRPERPEIAQQYEQDMPEFALRLQVKAGLTGFAQVYGKYNTEPYDKLQMDLLYISKQSIVTDLKLIFATIKVLFMPESTEGVEQGRKTAMK